MITLATNSKNSIYKDGTGSIALLSGAEALAQTLGQISRTRRGEMPFNTKDGVPYWDTIFQTKDVLLFEAAMRAEFNKHPEVTGVESFNVQTDGEVITYTAQVLTIYGALKIDG